MANKFHTDGHAYLTAGVLCIAATLASSAGYAQTAASGSSQGAYTKQGSAPADDGLTEIIVTAERRSEDLQKAALSISVRDGAELQQEGKFNLGQILEDVPDASFNPATGAGPLGGGTDSPGIGIVIRGISANSFSGGGGVSTVPAVASYVDGVYGGIGGDYDINSVEVLRGPQGTLYGRSATAGVLNTHTIGPRLGDFGGDATVEVGDHDLKHEEAGINLPVGDEFAVRLSGMRYSRDGLYASEGGENSETAGKIKALYEPNDKLSVLVGLALQDDTTHSGGLQGQEPTVGQVVYEAVPLGEGHDNFRQYWAQVDWDFGPAILTYIPALRTWEQNAVVNNLIAPGLYFAQTIQTPHDHFHTEELRLASQPDQRLTWQVGALYYDNNLQNGVTNIEEPLDVFEADAVVNKTTTNEGVFGEDTFRITDAVRLTTGVRYDHTRVNVNEEFTSPSSPLPGAPLTTLDLPSSEGVRTYNNFTYKVRLEGDVTAQNLLYGSVTTGFLPGDVQVLRGATGPQVSPFATETLQSFEVGSKNRFFDNMLQVNGDVFYYRYGAYQIGGVAVDPVHFVYATYAAPARVKGAELETIFQPTKEDRFTFDANYIDAEFVDQSATFLQYVALSRIPNVPKTAWFLNYSHTFKLPGSQSLSFGGDVRYRSSVDTNTITAAYLAAGTDEYQRVGGEYVGDITATWSVNLHASLSAYVRNVGDNRYITNGNALILPPLNTLQVFASQYDPRTFGLVLHVSF
jgi:outer membrane receptor protein involved in Fe transport